MKLVDYYMNSPYYRHFKSEAEFQMASRFCLEQILSKVTGDQNIVI